MNFGKWIVVAFILFAAFIATLVTVCVRQDVSLVSKDYYKEELGYQDQIHRLNNTAALAEKPVIKITDHALQVEFTQFAQVETGELKLFCPSNAKMDRIFTVAASDETTRTFEINNLQKGMYRAKLFWKMNGKEFYQEEIIYI
jgi:hypothetical protein